MKKKEDEMIMVTPAGPLLEIAHEGISFGCDNFVRHLFSGRYEFHRRGDVESDPTLKQIIPYILVRDTSGRFLVHQRGGKSGEQRLAGSLSLGIGGHINEDDAPKYSSNIVWFETFVRGAIREFREEISLSHVAGFKPVASLIALINDNSTEVGKVHMGAAMIVDVLEGMSVVSGEDDVQNVKWMTATELAENSVTERLESWSQLLVPVLGNVAHAEYLVNPISRIVL